MDGARFDALTKTKPDDKTTRRPLVRLLAAAILGLPVGTSVGSRAAQADSATARARRLSAARCAQPKKKCGPGKPCCGALSCKGGRCRCRHGRVAIDGRCAPPCNAICDASPICDCVNVADDQTGDAPACLRRLSPDTCAANDPCRTNADCGTDELCAKIADCSDGFNRCLRLCGDPDVTASDEP